MPSSKEKDLLLMFAPLYVVVLSALLLFSCGAAKSAQEISVKVPDQFVGALKISPCQREANPEPVVIDRQGTGSTSSCPLGGRQVTLVIMQNGRTYRISPDQVKIRRAGDG